MLHSFSSLARRQLNQCELYGSINPAELPMSVYITLARLDYLAAKDVRGFAYGHHSVVGRLYRLTCMTDATSLSGLNGTSEIKRSTPAG